MFGLSWFLQGGFIAFLFLGMIFCSMMLVRNNLIFRHRMKALDITSQKATEAIQLGDYNWQRFYEEKDAMGTYNSMMWMLTKWRFKDFYPNMVISEPKN